MPTGKPFIIGSPSGVRTRVIPPEKRDVLDHKKKSHSWEATGVGKSLFLQLSKIAFEDECKEKKIKPLVVEANCAHFAGGSSDLNMTRSELFGHKKGSFSGAVEDKKGIVEEANGGLLILEEVGELPLEVQAMVVGFQRVVKQKSALYLKYID